MRGGYTPPPGDRGVPIIEHNGPAYEYPSERGDGAAVYGEPSNLRDLADACRRSYLPRLAMACNEAANEIERLRERSAGRRVLGSRGEEHARADGHRLSDTHPLARTPTVMQGGCVTVGVTLEDPRNPLGWPRRRLSLRRRVAELERLLEELRADVTDLAAWRAPTLRSYDHEPAVARLLAGEPEAAMRRTGSPT